MSRRVALTAAEGQVAAQMLAELATLTGSLRRLIALANKPEAGRAGAALAAVARGLVPQLRDAAKEIGAAAATNAFQKILEKLAAGGEQ